MNKTLDGLFGKAEEINGRHRCPTYLYRWTMLVTRWFKIYLHHFVGDDWSLDLHDHPKRFISIGLWGHYIETTPCEVHGAAHPCYRDERKVYKAPWVRTFPATHIHRLVVPNKNCWTLVIVLKSEREWGFWHAGKFFHWRSYVDGPHSYIADKMKGCD